MASPKISHRQDKVAGLINASVMEALRKGKMYDRRLSGCPVTITKVSVTSDLKSAHCYFVPFNTDLSEEQLIEALNNSRSYIRHFVTEKIQLKYSPEIHFHYDHGFGNADKVEQLLRSLK